MDVIDAIIIYAETGEKPVGLSDTEEPKRIYSAIDSLRATSAKDFLTWYTNTKEFHRAKLTRAGALPKPPDTDSKITVDIVTNEDTGNSSISQD